MCRSEQPLLVPVAVVPYETVGQPQDLFRAAVILLQTDHLRAGKQRRELEDVQIGTAASRAGRGCAVRDSWPTPGFVPCCGNSLADGPPSRRETATGT